MVNIKKYCPFILLILITIILGSCVGNIKSKTPISTKVSSALNAVLDNFQGLGSATAISNTKVELFFNPILVDIDKYTYIINYDGQEIPVYIAANSLQVDYRGLVKYTVTGLNPHQKYSFSVQVREITTQQESSNNIKLSAITFANITADFVGISDVRNLSGSAGLNGIEVVWPEAQVTGTVLNKADGDPVEYKITIIDSAFLSPGNMNDLSFSEPLRKVVSAGGDQRSLVINGLKPNTKYFVQVRAIHYGHSANSANASYKY
jgi:hypothetical protein